MASTASLFGGAAITNLNGLSDVTAPSPTTRQILRHDGTAWGNVANSRVIAPLGYFVKGGGTVTVAGTDVWDFADKIPYRVLTGGAAAQSLNWAAIFAIPSDAPAFETLAVEFTYKLSVAAPNKVNLAVTGTDGVDAFTSPDGVATTKTVLSASATDLAAVVKAAGGLLSVLAKVTLDNAVTASIGPILLHMA